MKRMFKIIFISVLTLSQITSFAIAEIMLIRSGLPIALGREIHQDYFLDCHGKSILLQKEDVVVDTRTKCDPDVSSFSNMTPTIKEPEALIKQDFLLTHLFKVYNDSFFSNSLDKDTKVMWTPILNRNNVSAVIKNDKSEFNAYVILLSSFALIGSDQKAINEVLIRSMIYISFIEESATKKTKLTEQEYEKKEIKRIAALQSLSNEIKAEENNERKETPKKK